jgi:uncharacterized protein (TIGR01370 family)
MNKSLLITLLSLILSGIACKEKPETIDQKIEAGTPTEPDNTITSVTKNNAITTQKNEGMPTTTKPNNTNKITKSSKAKSTAVFYGANLPTNILSQYSRIIVEPDNVKPKELLALQAKDSRVFAYVSIGEVNPSRKWYKKIKPAWVLGDNKIWDSKVMDLSSPGWQNFLIETIIGKLWKDGYRGLFLDTMDSFYIFAKDTEQQEKQTKALTELMTKINKRYPDMRFISNRGFEVLESIGKPLEAVVAESLYASWDNGKKIYQETPKNDQEWLLNKLNGIKNNLSVDIIIIDYAKAGDRIKAKLIADKITEQGFIPWVSIPSLDLAGIGSITPKLETYLLLTDSKIDGHTPLKLEKYKKLVALLKQREQKIKVHDIQRGMPLGYMIGRYIGIISSLPTKQNSKTLITWLQKQKQEGIPIKRYP